jgi:hypothetical protein
MSSLGNIAEGHIYAQQSQPKYIATTYQMTSHDHSVVTDSSAGIFTITLPPVGECIGKNYQISFGGSGTNAVTVQDKANDSGYADQTMNAVNENLFLSCNGERWIEVIKE